MFHSREGKPTGTENKLVVAGGLGGWLTTKGNKGTSLVGENVLLFNCGGVYMTVHLSKFTTFRRLIFIVCNYT